MKTKITPMLRPVVIGLCAIALVTWIILQIVAAMINDKGAPGPTQYYTNGADGKLVRVNK